jgi:hypothetical protein
MGRGGSCCCAASGVAPIEQTGVAGLVSVALSGVTRNTPPERRQPADQDGPGAAGSPYRGCQLPSPHHRNRSAVRYRTSEGTAAEPTIAMGHSRHGMIKPWAAETARRQEPQVPPQCHGHRPDIGGRASPSVVKDDSPDRLSHGSSIDRAPIVCLAAHARSFVGRCLGARLREMSNICCVPGRAGGSPLLV